MTQSELKELTNLGAELLAAKAEVERLREALRWYEEKVTECRKIGSLGDNARQALDRDGGFRARDALSQQTEPTDAFTALLAERDEMRKYAERYQWLRNNWFRIYGRSLGERGICLEFGDDWNTAGKPEHVDAAIDQAMQGEQP